MYRALIRVSAAANPPEAHSVLDRAYTSQAAFHWVLPLVQRSEHFCSAISGQVVLQPYASRLRASWPVTMYP